MTVLGVIYDAIRPAWSQWNPGQLIDPYDIPDEILDTWVQTEPGGAGYNTQRGCYCWGYRPVYAPRTLDGVKWSSNARSWRICPSSCPCPPAPACPPQQTCPPPPPCPTTTVATVQDIRDSKNWLWLAGFGVAVAAVYGVRRTMQIRRRRS